jgi:hypothetical protein
MSKIKGQKLYILISESDSRIVGVWSNLTALIRESLNQSNASLYLKIYRHIKKHLDNGLNINDFAYEFINDDKKYKIKIETLR